MVKTLYFGNLPWGTKEADLVSFVEAEATVVSARIITEKETGKSKGFGFVDVNDEDAEKIVKTLNGKDFDGRSITVSEARVKKENNAQS